MAPPPPPPLPSPLSPCTHLPSPPLPSPLSPCSPLALTPSAHSSLLQASSPTQLHQLHHSLCQLLLLPTGLDVCEGRSSAPSASLLPTLQTLLVMLETQEGSGPMGGGRPLKLHSGQGRDLLSVVCTLITRISATGQGGHDLQQLQPRLAGCQGGPQALAQRGVHEQGARPHAGRSAVLCCALRCAESVVGRPVSFPLPPGHITALLAALAQVGG